MSLSPRRFPIRIHITTALALLVFLVGGCITWMSYQRATRILTASVMALAHRAADEASAELEHIIAPARMGVDMLAAEHALDTRSSTDARLKGLPAYVSALRMSPVVIAYYVGDEVGNYFLARRMLHDDDRRFFGAPPQTAFLAQSIERGADGERAYYLFFDDELNELGRIESASSLEFDPRKRPWYRLAAATEQRVVTEPYLFFSTKKQGVSIAQRAEDGVRTIGADIRLDTLNEVLTRHRMTPGSRLFMIDAGGRILAKDGLKVGDAEKPQNNTKAEDDLLARLFALKDGNAPEDGLVQQEIDGQVWHLGLKPMPLVEDRQNYLGIAIPEADMLGEARDMRNQLLILALALLFVAIPVAFWLARRIARPISALVEDTEAMRRFDFDRPINTRSMILEVDQLADTLRMTKSTLGHFMEIVGRLNNEKDFQRLLPELLRSTIRVSQVEGGLLLLADDVGLRPAAGQWEGRDLAVDGESHLEGDVFSARSALTAGGTVAALADPADCERFGTPARHACAVPLFNRERHPIGVLVLLSRHDIDPLRQCFIEALSGFAAMALETRELIAMQKALFAAFIKMMAGAIDAKSPYTGGHCARVPEIAQAIAEAACAQTAGPYAGFALGEEEWEALHIASWLHDCGKVTTPEYVVDKATKLETLYDRIHEIRMRFEVLKRDAEIDYLRQCAAGQPEAEARARRDETLRTLDEEFAFVAECNQGGEFMAPERVERLRRIAERTWQRTLDDRLGLSPEETRRKAKTPAPMLPVEEKLLADKPEHRFEHLEAPPFGPGNPWGFSMPVPELLFDRGELKNLMIPRGTLGDEERYKINEHITQTIVMLSALPFPRHLSRVPEIAGGHHERVDGKGYPRGLDGARMSPLARIMAIADVFEALTASDRPYKSPKTLGQSLEIMKKMAGEGHIDRELFRIFVASGAALRYAERFLAPEQIDTRDLSRWVEAPQA